MTRRFGVASRLVAVIGAARPPMPETTFHRSVRYATYVVSPPTVFFSLGYALAWAKRPFWSGVYWGSFYGLLTSVLPLLFVVWMLKAGRITTISMTQRERNLPYLLGALAAVVAYGVLRALEAPELLLCLALFNALGLGSLGAINLFWKISNHATAVGAGALIAGLVYGSAVGWLLSPVALAICAARIYLRKHTVGQVAAGLLLGVAGVLLLAQGGCFAP